MMLYINNTKGQERTILIDFTSIKERVEYHIPETTLYRLLQKRCCKSYRYRNRDLYSLKDILGIPELAKDLKLNDNEEKIYYDV
jgi:hypothetical protein